MTTPRQPAKRARGRAQKRYKPGSYMDLYMAVGRYVKAQGGCVVVAGGIQTIRWPGQSQYNFTIGVSCTGKAPSYDEPAIGIAAPRKERKQP